MANPAQFDLLIRNATVIDGMNTRRFRGDIGVRGDSIAHVGPLDGARASLEIDASGLVAAPGFIDAHTHDDRLLLSHQDMAPKVSQGVTTVVVGNCGISLAPFEAAGGAGVTAPLDLLDDSGGWYKFPTFAAYLEELRSKPAAANAACLVGHTTLRIATMDALERPASRAEIAKMRAIAREALAAGAIGVSTGTFYPPAQAAPTEEIIAVCADLREFGGLYVTHMRNEAEHVIDAMDETFTIGRTLGVPAVISHHKVIGEHNYGRSKETLAHIERHRGEQSIGLDCYPYHASSTVLSPVRLSLAKRVLVTWSKPHPEFAGMDLAEVAQRLGTSQEESVKRLQPGGAIYFTMNEDDVQRILAFDDTMIGSDGLPHDAKPHPRLWGTFPRVLGHYSRDLKLFPLETAVYKMTGLPAKKFGLDKRGVLKAGHAADLALFDPETVADLATFERPIEPAQGIDTVIVNGAIVWRHGQATGERPGRVLSTQRSTTK